MITFSRFRNHKISLFVLAMAFLMGWITSTLYIKVSGEASGPEVAQIREDSPKYKYINPLLYVDNSNSEFEELNGLKRDMERHIEAQVAENKIDAASFYYRDLNSGAWTGVNPDDKYVPASILKIGTLITYLRLIEDDPNIMNEKLLYKKNPNEKQNYPPSAELEEGYYDVGKLLGQSIIESDNAAHFALTIPRERELGETFAALRLPIPPTKLKDFMSPKEVSVLFRSLYSSTYLLSAYSEQALELLTRTKFNEGITRGVDPNIPVAHKFGEHTVYSLDPQKTPGYQLHDCGIVYYPTRPYFICVMTKGKNLENMKKVISDISAKTFNFVKEEV